MFDLHFSTACALVTYYLPLNSFSEEIIEKEFSHLEYINCDLETAPLLLVPLSTFSEEILYIYKRI